jgi:hypothetical protein
MSQGSTADSQHLIAYHYTNASSMMSIIGNQEVWATHLAYLNDPGELQLGLASVKYALDNASPDEHWWPRQFEAIQQAAMDWQETPVSVIDFDSQFAACFSTDGDSLSQWRSYGRHPGAGPGVALGFRMDELKTLSDNVDAVQYVASESEGAALVRHWVDLLDPEVGPQPEHGTHGSPFNPERVLWWQKALAAGFLKHVSYRDEQEIRVLAKASHGKLSNPREYGSAIRYRPSTYGLTPYIALSLENVALHEVIVGPSAHLDLAVNSIQAHIATQMPEPNVTVRPSTVLYRDW